MQRLEGEDCILGHTAITDSEKAGAGHIAFVQVRQSDTKSAARDTSNRAARRIAAIEQCHSIAGEFDYLLEFRTRDFEPPGSGRAAAPLPRLCPPQSSRT